MAEPLFDVEFGAGALGMYLVSSDAGNGLVVEKFSSDDSGVPLAAEKTGQISIGDAIVAVNGESIRGMAKAAALFVLTESHRPATITFLHEGGFADIERLWELASADVGAANVVGASSMVETAAAAAFNDCKHSGGEYSAREHVMIHHGGDTDCGSTNARDVTNSGGCAADDDTSEDTDADSDGTSGYGATDYPVAACIIPSHLPSRRPAPKYLHDSTPAQDNTHDITNNKMHNKMHDTISQPHQFTNKTHETHEIISTLEGELTMSRAQVRVLEERKQKDIEEGHASTGVVDAVRLECERAQLQREGAAQVTQLQRDLQTAAERADAAAATATELAVSVAEANGETEELRLDNEELRLENDELRLENDTLQGKGQMQQQLVVVELQEKCAWLEAAQTEGSMWTEEASSTWHAKEKAMREELKRVQREGAQMGADMARKEQEMHLMKHALRKAREEVQELAMAQVESISRQQRQQQQLDDTTRQAHQAEERALEKEQQQLESAQASSTAEAAEMVRLREECEARGKEVEALSRKCSMYEEQLAAVRDEALSSGVKVEQQQAASVAKMARRVEDLQLELAATKQQGQIRIERFNLQVLYRRYGP
jgi:hypothetical protein